MLRIILIELLCFALPFFAYSIWRDRYQDVEGDSRTEVSNGQLAIAGVVLALVVLAIIAVMSGSRDGEPGAQYVPPRLENGEVVDGFFREPDTSTDADADTTEDPQ